MTDTARELEEVKHLAVAEKALLAVVRSNPYSSMLEEAVSALKSTQSLRISLENNLQEREIKLKSLSERTKEEQILLDIIALQRISSS